MSSFRLAIALSLSLGLVACVESKDVEEQTPTGEGSPVLPGGETPPDNSFSDDLSVNPSLPDPGKETPVNPTPDDDEDTVLPPTDPGDGNHDNNNDDDKEKDEDPPVEDPKETDATPTGLQIKAILAEGDGCPEGTVDSQISDDAKAFTVSFSAFAAEITPGVRKVDKQCRLVLKVDVPMGWQYSVASFNHRGYLALDEGIRATHLTRYYFGRYGRGGGFRHIEEGEISKDFVYTDAVGLGTAYISHQWSPCSRSVDLHIDSSVRLENTDLAAFPDASGLIAKDSVDAEVVQKFGLSWRRCKS